jgi:hypothetical protein
MLTVMEATAQQMGWNIISTQLMSANEYKVLVKREDCPEDRAYSTHKFSSEANSFYWGQYDMTRVQALEHFAKR